MTEEKRFCLVYSPPAGTTGKVNHRIAAMLEERGYPTSELDLGKTVRPAAQARQEGMPLLRGARAGLPRREEQDTRYYL